MNKNKPILIVGLGNPGAQYARTRHNAGFIAIDAIAGTDAVWKSEHNAQTTRGAICGAKIIFVKPQTFMNDSGRAVGALATFYKIPPENIIVIHDDMDLKPGTFRTKVGGGSAGHNGIRSIDAAIGPEYHRIRIGIGHPRDVALQMDPADWVLGKFSDEDMAKIMDIVASLPGVIGGIIENS